MKEGGENEKRKESIRKKKEKENSHRGGLDATHIWTGRGVGVNMYGGRAIHSLRVRENERGGS